MTWNWTWLRPEESDFDAVLQRLLNEAAAAIPGLSTDLKQADPVVVMLLRAFAREYVELYRRMDDSVGMAYRALVSRLLTFPHAPQPATTVLRLEVKDVGTRVPTAFQAVAPEPLTVPGRRSAQAQFTPISEHVISGFEVAALVLVEPSGTATRLADPPYPGLPARWQARVRGTPALFLALDAEAPSPQDPVEVFLFGDERGVRQCLWSAWHVPSRLGGEVVGIRQVLPEPPFVPGDAYYARWPFDPPVFTFRSDLQRLTSPYELQMVSVGGSSLVSHACTAPRELGDTTPGLPPPKGVRHWVRVTLGAGADLAAVLGVRARTNSVLAANREIRTSGPIAVPDTPLNAWTLPDDVSLENLLRIERVLDLKSGHEFQAATTREGLEALRSYRVVEWAEGDRMRVRVDTLNRDQTRRPTEFQIDYSLTLGDAANGLKPGSVNMAFTPASVLPGLVSVSNLVESIGGRPARPAELQEDELRTALRARGRAVVAYDYVEMVRWFDPDRIRDVTLDRGVARGPRGLRSSVVVTTRTEPGCFVNELEREAFRKRLSSYLQDRCTVGETIDVHLSDANA